MLLNGLPSESLTWTAIRDGMTREQREAQPRAASGWGPWSLDRLMLATVADRLARIEWVLHAANSKKAPPYPKPIPRPGVAGGPMEQREEREALRMIATLKARQALNGGQPSEEQIEAALDALTEEGDDDE